MSSIARGLFGDALLWPSGASEACRTNKSEERKLSVSLATRHPGVKHLPPPRALEISGEIGSLVSALGRVAGFEIGPANRWFARRTLRQERPPCVRPTVETSPRHAVAVPYSFPPMSLETPGDTSVAVVGVGRSVTGRSFLNR